MFAIGQTVALVTNRTVSTSGANSVITSGAVGRICRVTPGGLYRVAFAGFGCRLVPESQLTPAMGTAPSCESCRQR